MDLYSEIMNIPTIIGTYNDEFCYKLGHRDARHAAAELSLKVEARIDELEAVLSKFVNWTTNEAGTISLGDDVELWELAEKVLENK